MQTARPWRMIVYFSKESRYRNMMNTPGESGARQPRLIVIGVIGLVIAACIVCLGVFIGFQLNERLVREPAPAGAASKVTPTADMKAVVPFKGKGLGENGLEVTVTAFQRPLQVQGLSSLAPDQQFVLVTVSVRNTRTSGAATNVSPAEFKLTGDGGLTYNANPPIVTIQNLLSQQDVVPPGRALERELIFQIAKDDSGLKLYWTAGNTTRTFLLEAQQ